MSELDYGVFRDFWNGHPNHLPLMGLHEYKGESSRWNLTKSLERLDLICDSHSKELIVEGIHKLLYSENWRPHLVAILASFKLPTSEQKRLVPDFWLLLEKGSWVSPQILSVLSMVDDEFESKGRQILNDGFQVNFSSMGMVEHHSARGPEGSQGASEKGVSSIKALLDHHDDDFGWKGNLLRLIKNERFRVNTIQSNS